MGINSCPRCSGHLARQSGFWRCEKCGHVMHYSQGLGRTSYSTSEYIPADLYSYFKGKWAKVVGRQKSLDEEIK
jgi:DNA-directed RNA polymerase subunit M/transcription elongation factor TFIIS